MVSRVLLSLMLLSTVFCMPYLVDLDDEEQQLYRVVYDEDFDEEMEMNPVGILDPREAIWLMKAKLKEVKEFMRALAANLLSTKLKIKELVKKHMLNYHNHIDHNNRPSHYQPHQHHAPQKPTYEPTQYGHDMHDNY